LPGAATRRYAASWPSSTTPPAATSPRSRRLGLGNAVAIALDATLVRLVLVPAAMQLMGRWNWWLPGWLDRLLPDLGFESGPKRAPSGKSAPAGA
jgi:hypothetical protein